MNPKKSLADVLLKNRYRAPAGKGDLASIKVGPMGIESDEEQAKAEQAQIDRDRLLKALQMLAIDDKKKSMMPEADPMGFRAARSEYEQEEKKKQGKPLKEVLKGMFKP